MNQPLYKQVTDYVIERIKTGAYPPGGMLPNEFELADSTGVSQGTARKALADLESRGIIERRQGKGSFVTLRTPENSLFHFFRLRKEDGSQVVPEKIHEAVKTRASTASEKNNLYGAPSKVVEISRVRGFEGHPLCHETCVFSAERFPGLADRTPLPNTLYVLLQQAYGCIIMSASERLSAAALDAAVAGKMNLEPGTPVLVSERISRDLEDRAVEIRTSVFLTENAKYFVELR